jgi:hypothetical protein
MKSNPKSDPGGKSATRDAVHRVAGTSIDRLHAVVLKSKERVAGMAKADAAPDSTVIAKQDISIAKVTACETWNTHGEQTFRIRIARLGCRTNGPPVRLRLATMEPLSLGEPPEFHRSTLTDAPKTDPLSYERADFDSAADALVRGSAVFDGDVVEKIEGIVSVKGWAKLSAWPPVNG